MKKIFIILAVCFMPFAFSGCATAPSAGPGYIPGPIERPKIPGAYHKVEKGQTLWRIAKFYNVSIDDIVKINRVPDATQISVGQLLFIPYANVIKPAESEELNKAFEKSDFIWPVKGSITSFTAPKKTAF